MAPPRVRAGGETAVFFAATLAIWGVWVAFEMSVNRRSELVLIVAGFFFFQAANWAMRLAVSRDPLFVNTAASLLHSTITSASGLALYLFHIYPSGIQFTSSSYEKFTLPSDLPCFSLLGVRSDVADSEKFTMDEDSDGNACLVSCGYSPGGGRYPPSPLKVLLIGHATGCAGRFDLEIVVGLGNFGWSVSPATAAINIADRDDHLQGLEAQTFLTSAQSPLTLKTSNQSPSLRVGKCLVAIAGSDAVDISEEDSSATNQQQPTRDGEAESRVTTDTKHQATSNPVSVRLRWLYRHGHSDAQVSVEWNKKIVVQSLWTTFFCNPCSLCSVCIGLDAGAFRAATLALVCVKQQQSESFAQCLDPLQHLYVDSLADFGWHSLLDVALGVQVGPDGIAQVREQLTHPLQEVVVHGLGSKVEYQLALVQRHQVGDHGFGLLLRGSRELINERSGRTTIGPLATGLGLYWMRTLGWGCLGTTCTSRGKIARGCESLSTTASTPSSPLGTLNCLMVALEASSDGAVEELDVT
ncbi:hypothetical protein ZIOFF_073046 [Zingiber officinale]|uniref:Transmembrane protein n=1 Tax=Zingiber officinale TaxID=94328 RepID=A0A8J5C6I7_ZINOF|nr:hypothetical protein ZIOFF_073046 [Zingiber officinale]